MKTVLAALIATTALAVTFSHGKDESIETASHGDSYVIAAGGMECAISGTGKGSEARRVELGSGCDAASPAAKATHIVKRDDGSVDLLGARGEPVVRFAAAEGGTHVSYEPQSPLIQLIAVD